MIHYGKNKLRSSLITISEIIILLFNNIEKSQKL